ncbi:MAG: class I SAM-dependent methyltransferase [Thermodesulfobacteriota bacterium]
MKRIPEPELMLEPDQVAAYAEADFEGPHSNFINLFKEKFPGSEPRGRVLDLGSGPGDISFRFASAFPNTQIHAIEGSMEMIKYDNNLLSKKTYIKNKIIFIHSTIQDFNSLDKYEYIISNSLLHHLSDPMILWEAIKKYLKRETKIFIMDLLRPESIEQAMKLTNIYAKNEPDVLRRDFHRSLLAAFEVVEVKEQLNKAELALKVEQVSDRHLIAYG